MAFRTNKVPAIEERTVSGSSVSFNSAFALPLKACKVRVNITQSGSGTPTMLNRRPFVNISSLGITHNNILSNVPLGSDYYDFELDLNTGILTSYWYVFRADEYTWRETGTVFYCTDPSVYTRPEYIKKNGLLNIKSDVYDTNDTNDLSVYGNVQNRVYYIRDTQYLGNITDFKAHLTNDNVMLAFELATPITIQLSANELSSIIGNNTFSTDTGTLEITFADLQTKSASGSVATFNTALAMPLVECKTEFMATQEGTGDATPVNARPFIPVEDVTFTANGVDIVVDLDGSRYGGSIDLASGIMTLKYYYFKPDNNFNVHLYDHGATRSLFDINYANNNIPLAVANTVLSSHFTRGISGSGGLSNGNTLIFVNIDNSLISPENAVGFKTWAIENSLEFVYEMETPIEISLSDIPTLSTMIGNNSFASDSGSIELKYKDLDIAKRGNFREVFKLPS